MPTSKIISDESMIGPNFHRELDEVLMSSTLRWRPRPPPPKRPAPAQPPIAGFTAFGWFLALAAGIPCWPLSFASGAAPEGHRE